MLLSESLIVILCSHALECPCPFLLKVRTHQRLTLFTYLILNEQKCSILHYFAPLYTTFTSSHKSSYPFTNLYTPLQTFTNICLPSQIFTHISKPLHHFTNIHIPSHPFPNLHSLCKPSNPLMMFIVYKLSHPFANLHTLFKTFTLFH